MEPDLLARAPTARTVRPMTTADLPKRTCAYCPHDLEPHMLLVIEEPLPAGIVLCEEPGCTCGATWCATVGRSTREQIDETRHLVRQRLLDDGYPLLDFLREDRQPDEP
jgi:hypothetical protein